MIHSNYDSDFWDDDLDEEFEDDFSQPTSNSLVSVPASVRQQISRVPEPIQLTQQQMMQGAMQQALVELARSAPQLAAPLIGATIGVRKVTETNYEKNEYYERVRHKVLGLDCGDRFVPLTASKTQTKMWVVE